MLRFRPVSSNSTTMKLKTTTVGRALDLKYSIKKAKSSILWGLVNIMLLGCIIYDLTYNCSYYTTTFNYIEYGLAVIFTLNILYHLVRYFVIIVSAEPLRLTQSDGNVLKNQKAEDKTIQAGYLLGKATSTTSELASSSKDADFHSFTLNSDKSMNTSVLNWHSNQHNESLNYSLPSPSWVYRRGTPERVGRRGGAPVGPGAELETEGDPSERISSEKMLQQYLYDFDTQDKAQTAAATGGDSQGSLLASYWTSPNASQSMPQDVAHYLRKAQYQLAQPSPPHNTSSTTGAKDESSPLNVSQRGNDVWKKLQIEPQVLTQWNANLRMWISQTILERLITEIDSINQSLVNHQLPDVQVGLVGLERLRKTGLSGPGQQHVPTLAALLPFLELSPQQGYLVRRLRDLARGGCISDYKWNAGAKFNGKEWDDSLPTDSAIIMHILSTYLDSQLLPLPNQPDAKPFSKEHFIRIDDKLPSNPDTLAIHHVSDKPPYYRLIVGQDIYEVAKGHNNLFHTILLFLYYVNKKEHGMLGKVNMGKSGVNMLWILEC